MPQEPLDLVRHVVVSLGKRLYGAGNRAALAGLIDYGRLGVCNLGIAGAQRSRCRGASASRSDAMETGSSGSIVSATEGSPTRWRRRNEFVRARVNTS